MLPELVHLNSILDQPKLRRQTGFKQLLQFGSCQIAAID
jgi:hypothetical protein